MPPNIYFHMHHVHVNVSNLCLTLTCPLNIDLWTHSIPLSYLPYLINNLFSCTFCLAFWGLASSHMGWTLWNYGYRMQPGFLSGAARFSCEHDPEPVKSSPAFEMKIFVLRFLYFLSLLYSYRDASLFCDWMWVKIRLNSPSSKSCEIS